MIDRDSAAGGAAMTLDLWLIRHAESIGNVDASESDTSLSEDGVAQAECLRRLLADVAFDRVFTSPLLRARETAERAVPEASITIDARITELAPGRGVQFLDTSALDPAKLQEALAAISGPPTESGKEFMRRVRSWLTELPPRGRVCVFTHAGVIREILGMLLGYSEAPQRVLQAAVFQLELGEGAPRRLRWNDVAHVRGRAAG